MEGRECEARVWTRGRRALAVPGTQRKAPAHNAIAITLVEKRPEEREEIRTERFKGLNLQEKGATQKKKSGRSDRASYATCNERAKWLTQIEIAILHFADLILSHRLRVAWARKETRPHVGNGKPSLLLPLPSFFGFPRQSSVRPIHSHEHLYPAATERWPPRPPGCRSGPPACRRESSKSEESAAQSRWHGGPSASRY